MLSCPTLVGSLASSGQLEAAILFLTGSTTQILSACLMH